MASEVVISPEAGRVLAYMYERRMISDPATFAEDAHRALPDLTLDEVRVSFAELVRAGYIRRADDPDMDSPPRGGTPWR